MATSPPSPHLFPATFYAEPLETWAAALHTLPLEAAHCVLEQIVHYKAHADMEHEFLVVHARHPSGAEIVLGVDRNVEALVPPAPTGPDGSAPAPEPVSPSASSSARYLGTLLHLGVPSGPPSPGAEAGPPAYDGVQVSHDGTPAPILAQHGPARPSLLHLSILLLTIRAHFPSYALLEHQCYFFARATTLALRDAFRGAEAAETAHAFRGATWRGVHVSLFAAGRAALQNMLLLPLADAPVLAVPAGLFAAYSALRMYEGHAVGEVADRRRIRCVVSLCRAGCWWGARD
ncbi:hypothetical protein BC834DRAFT_856774 [Gloeopeniophorella convolvens]|nr:hypothetical protein BC834DRAFT_856774 [Gloeopeniophorella convolvens]